MMNASRDRQVSLIFHGSRGAAPVGEPGKRRTGRATGATPLTGATRLATVEPADMAPPCWPLPVDPGGQGPDHGRRWRWMEEDLHAPRAPLQGPSVDWC